MRRLFTILLASLSIGALARQITPEEASAAASDFMNASELSGVMSSNKTLRQMKALGMNPNDGWSPYYIFNRGEKDGFVIISGDDRAPKILGYSDKGSIDAENIPPQLKDLMESWTKQINSMTGETAHASWNSTASTRSGEGVLMETANWGQGYPYNAMCPIIDGIQAPAGCVATAMAIAMKYHNWPESTRGGVESDYYFPDENFDFDNYNIDWDVLNNNDDPSFCEQVSKLTYSAGIAVQMIYGEMESAAEVWPVSHQLQYFYAYDKNCQYLPREKFSDTEWNEILRSQLEEIGPVIYNGFGTVGHCFVLDGYNADGLYHVNWGWDGSSNGYFSLDFSFKGGTNFAENQGMIINLRPDKQKNVYSRAWITNSEEYIGGAYGCNGWNFMTPNVRPNELNRFLVPAITLSGLQGYISIGIVNEEDTIKEVITLGACNVDGFRYFCPYPGTDPELTLTLPELKEGERYQLISQEVPNGAEVSGSFEHGYSPIAPPSEDPSDWYLVLGGIIYPSHFYSEGNHSEVSEVRFHIDEFMPSYCQINNTYEHEFTIYGLKGGCSPENIFIPQKGVTLDVKAYDKNGNPSDAIYVGNQDEYPDNQIGFNLSLYDDQFDVYIRYNWDGDTRKDSEISRDKIVDKDGLVYKIENETLVLIGYDKVGETVTIPESIFVGDKMLDVRGVDKEALMFAPIKNLIIESQCLDLKQFAFGCMENLETISLSLNKISFSGIEVLPFVKSGVKTVYVDELLDQDNVFALISGLRYTADKVAIANENIDFILTKLPSTNPADCFFSLQCYNDIAPREQIGNALGSYILPGISNGDLDEYKGDISFNISQMWSYEIDKELGWIRIKYLMENVSIESVSINGIEVNENGEGIYKKINSPLESISDATGISVTVNYTINGQKRSTVYTADFNNSLPQTYLGVQSSSILLSSEAWNGCVGESFKIEATVMPVDASYKSLGWSSSDESVAVVDSDGLVTAVGVGEAIIIATLCADTSIYANCLVKVTIMGDSNSDGIVNVADAVNTANYIVDFPTTDFNFEMSDINSDTQITVSDVTSIIDLIATQNYEDIFIAKRIKGHSMGYLVNRALKEEGLSEIAISTEEEISALQFDIKLTEKKGIPTLRLNKNFVGSHALQIFALDANTLRVVVFSASGKLLSSNEPVIFMTQESRSLGDEVAFENIFASSQNGKSMSLGYENRGDTNGVLNPAISNPIIVAENGKVCVTNINEELLSIYSLDGCCIFRKEVSAEFFEIPLSKGMFIVKVGNKSQRVIIR